MDVVEPAPSGRARCRGCEGAIARGELRFGEGFTSPFAEGESRAWFHLRCAAWSRPERLLAVIEAGTPHPDAAELARVARSGLGHRRLQRIARVERAASGRARCRSCKEPIERGCLRFVLRIFEEGRFQPAGYAHVTCAAAYFETRDLLERAKASSPALGPDDLVEFAGLLAP